MNKICVKSKQLDFPRDFLGVVGVHANHYIGPDSFQKPRADDLLSGSGDKLSVLERIHIYDVFDVPRSQKV